MEQSRGKGGNSRIGIRYGVLTPLLGRTSIALLKDRTLRGQPNHASEMPGDLDSAQERMLGYNDPTEAEPTCSD